MFFIKIDVTIFINIIKQTHNMSASQTQQEEWNVMMDKLLAYISHNGNIYSLYRDDEELNLWVGHQTVNYNPVFSLSKHCMLIPEVHNKWAETLAKYSEHLESEEMRNWRVNRVYVLEHIYATKCVPSLNDAKPHCRLWIDLQKDTYDPVLSQSKLHMKIPELHQLWKETLVQYNGYL